MTDLLMELEALAATYDFGEPYGWDVNATRVAKQIRTLIAAEKARGPDPLREGLEELRDKFAVVDSYWGPMIAEELDALLSTAGSEQQEPAELEKRYVIERGFIRVRDKTVMFGTNDRGWREIPMMPSEVEHEKHKGVWMVMLVREGRDDFPLGIQEPPPRPAEQQEVADLRRKLEETQAAMVRSREEYHAINAAWHDLSLANAALRKALEGIMPFADSATKVVWDRATAVIALANAVLWRAAYDVRKSTSGFKVASIEQWEKLDAALALPVDGLAEEMRKYMRHDPKCLAANNGYNGTDEPCTCGLDALLAKLGARP